MESAGMVRAAAGRLAREHTAGGSPKTLHPAADPAP